MTYDKISQFRVGQTYKYNTIYVEEILNNRGSRSRAYTPIWSFQEAGVSIYSRGSENKRKTTDSGTENSIYNKSPQKLSFSYQTICKIYWKIIKHYCYTSSGCISEKKRIWLRKSVREKLKWFIVLIDWANEKFLRYIGYWFQRGFSFPVRTIQS